MRFLAIDYGKARIGLAVSEVGIALPAGQISAGKTATESARLLFESVKSRAPFTKIIIGDPLYADGTASKMSAEVRFFGKALQPFFPETEIIYYNERHTSSHAELLLAEDKNRKNKLDEMSALMILRFYLSEHG